MEERHPIWRVAVNKLNKQPRTADEGWSSSLGLGEMLKTPLGKKHMLRITRKLRCFLWRQNSPEVNYSHTRFSGGRGVFLEEVSCSRKRNRDILLGTWNVRSLYIAGSLMKMDRQEVGEGRGDWMELAQDRDRWRGLVGTVRDFRVP
jgi:hypothetical protein